MDGLNALNWKDEYEYGILTTHWKKGRKNQLNKIKWCEFTQAAGIAEIEIHSKKCVKKCSQKTQKNRIHKYNFLDWNSIADFH